GRSTAVRENWQWEPAVAERRDADDFVLLVKRTKAQAEAIRGGGRGGLVGRLKLRREKDKTKINQLNEGIFYLGGRGHCKSRRF
ncbi:group II intron reverse transcriptase/maturase, partial [Escherichia coli]|nr:group II intron reverse transcriptase/maturase [Escherichia coli]